MGDGFPSRPAIEGFPMDTELANGTERRVADTADLGPKTPLRCGNRDPLPFCFRLGHDTLCRTTGLSRNCSHGPTKGLRTQG
jgi:hypothetical protein